MIDIMLFFLAGAPPLPPCDQEAADEGIQQEMNICAANDFAKADDELNLQWHKTREAMKVRDANWDPDLAPDWDDRPGYLATLLKAQRAWLKYRDAHCLGEAYIARGGSLEPLLNLTCKTALTKERTAQLRELALTY